MRAFFFIILTVFTSAFIAGSFAQSACAQTTRSFNTDFSPTSPAPQPFPNQTIQQTFQPDPTGPLGPTTLDEAVQNIRAAEVQTGAFSQQQRLFDTQGSIIDFQTGEFQGIFTQDFSSDVSPDPQRVSGFLSRFFVFLLGLVGVSAFFMISWGGFQYATSMANPGAISAAKEKIWGALFGLALAASSYIILRTINPDLVRFNITPSAPIQLPTPPITDSQVQSARNANPIQSITPSIDANLQGPINPGELPFSGSPTQPGSINFR